MADTEPQNAELMDDAEFQIVDLDPPDSPRRRQAARVNKIIRAGLTTRWIRYGLPGTLVLLLLGALILQWAHSAPAASSITAYKPPATVLAVAFARDLVFIQDTNFTLTAFQLATGRPRWHTQLSSAAWMHAGDQTHLYCLFTTSVAKNTAELEALDIQTGKVLWHDTLSAIQSTFLSSPIEDFTPRQTNYIASTGRQTPYFLYQDQTIYLHTVDDTIYAIQASNGQTRWTYQVKASGPSPGSHIAGFPWLVAQNGVIEFQALNFASYLLDASTGRELLSFPSGASGNPVFPTIDGQTALILPPPSQSPIRAFHLPDGQPLWTYSLSKDSWAMAEDNGTLYLSTASNTTLTALRISDRQQIWSYHTSDNQSFSYPYWNKAGDLIYVLQQDATLISLRASDGQVLWHTRVAGLANYVSQGLAMTYQNDTIVLFDATNANYAVTTAPVYVLSASTGHLLWHSSTPSGPFMLLADTLYTMQPSGQVDAWRNSDGQHLWSYHAPAGGTLYARPDPHSAQLFLLDLAGKLSILRASDGKLLWRFP